MAMGRLGSRLSWSNAQTKVGTMSSISMAILAVFGFTDPSLVPGVSARRSRFHGRCRARVVRWSITDDEGIRGIGTGPVIRLGHAVDFLAFVLPRGQEVGNQDVADVV